MARRRLIARSTPRALFTELLARVLDDAELEPSPMAVAYLVGLLEGRLRAPPTPEGETTLAEALLTARLERGRARIERMRELGDRALFVSGFFEQSLRRARGVDPGYYGAVGRSAYGDLAAVLGSAVPEPSWGRLFEELADCFAEFAELLSEVGERTWLRSSADVLRLYERYLRTGSPRDRCRLVRLGTVPPDPRRGKTWQ